VAEPLSRVILALIAVIIIVSLIHHPHPDSTSSQPLLRGARVDARVLSIIDRGCRDCHSDQVRYPWYSYIAPVSWLVERDVAEGREHLNFSRWTDYSVIRRERCLSEVANQIRDGGMPLQLYTLIHAEARLSQAERDEVFEWTQTERARLIAESIAGGQSQ
jgi:hypothetical protein